jgi:anaphase-promoting complex subunit 1
VPLFSNPPDPFPGFESPPSVFSLLEIVSSTRKLRSIPTIDKILPSQISQDVKAYAAGFTPRMNAILLYLAQILEWRVKSDKLVETMIASGINVKMAETYPEALLAIVREPIVQCQANPPTTWPSKFLSYVSREDLNLRTMSARLTCGDGHAGKVSSQKYRGLRIAYPLLGHFK